MYHRLAPSASPFGDRFGKRTHCRPEEDERQVSGQGREKEKASRQKPGSCVVAIPNPLGNQHGSGFSRPSGAARTRYHVRAVGQILKLLMELDPPRLPSLPISASAEPRSNDPRGGLAFTDICLDMGKLEGVSEALLGRIIFQGRAQRPPESLLSSWLHSLFSLSLFN